MPDDRPPAAHPDPEADRADPPGEAATAGAQADATPVAVLLTDLSERRGWEACVRSLAASGHDLALHAAVEQPGQADELRAHAPDVAELVAATPSDALRAVAEAGRWEHVLVVTEPVIVPPRFLDGALAIVAADPRVATVSQWTNDAGYLSFPHRNTPATHQVDDLDEVSVTRRLRTRSPEVLPVPVPLAVGAATLLAGPALQALGTVPSRVTGAGLVGAVSGAAQRKGFLSVVDPSTFYLTPTDIDGGPHDRVVPDIGDLGHFAVLVDSEAWSTTSPLASAHLVSRAKALGLRVGIDGTCLGPREMGTQVQTLHIIRSLVRNPEVSEVVVGLAHGIPGYARTVLLDEKVRTVPSTDDDMSALVGIDILHRPFQPQRRIDLDAWRKVAPRTVVSILDLIAYRNGAYHASAPTWLAYRDAVRATLAEVDGAVVISQDVKQQMLLERLPLDAGRIHVVELGTDHVIGDETERIPDELVARGFMATEFVVVLGATYAHKNRDQAIRAVRTLRAGGRDIGLVLVGAPVPHGSSRSEEAIALQDDPGEWLFSIPDVATEERNWLLRHAVAVLYPTSAEGFGFIPFEAARFDTPTLCVPFGPLSELVPRLPVAADSWSGAALASAIERVTSDPAVARSQVKAVFDAGGQFTWGRSASKLVRVYRDLLACPSR
jgi:glycosyltransferase involved in cell wall biosynthesis